MDNAPRYKLAKVGEKRRRKGMGFSWFGGKSGGGSWFGAGSAGAGSTAGGATGLAKTLAALLAVLGGKTSLVLLVAALGAGAFAVGRSLVPDPRNFQASKKPRLFADKNYSAEDLANVNKTQMGADSLGMVRGSLDGKTAEQRAAEAAAAEAAAKAQAEADAKAAAEAGKDQPGAAVPDPAALAAAEAAKAAAEAKGMESKFGELSKGLGGSGLSGGAGLSGGVTRGFDSPLFKAESGKLSPFSSRSSVNRAAARSARVGRGGRRAYDDAQKINSLKSQTGSSNKETSAAAAGQGFDNSAGTAGSPIGAGSGLGGGSGGSPGGAGSSGGGPTPVFGMSDPRPPAPDNCEAIFPGEGRQNTQSGGCGKAQNAVNVDHTNTIIRILKGLLIAATVLGLVQLVAKFVPGAAGLYTALGFALMGIGASIAVLGTMLVGMGRPLEGAIFAVVGTVIAAMAWLGHGSAKTAAEQAAAKELIKKFPGGMHKMPMLSARYAATAAGSMAAGGAGSAFSLTGPTGIREMADHSGFGSGLMDGMGDVADRGRKTLSAIDKAGGWNGSLNPETRNWEP